MWCLPTQNSWHIDLNIGHILWADLIVVDANYFQKIEKGNACKALGQKYVTRYPDML